MLPNRAEDAFSSLKARVPDIGSALPVADAIISRWDGESGPRQQIQEVVSPLLEQLI
jgi:hypothetical protein